MARRNALIRSLPAVETLGSATVIGSDKTGTLTQNEMTVTTIWTAGSRYSVTGAGYNADGEIRAGETSIGSIHEGPLYFTLLTGLLANEADPQFLSGSDPVGDPTELALFAAAAKGGLPVEQLRHDYAELDIVPFESEQRFMATLNDGPHGPFIYLKGAPEFVLGICNAQYSHDRAGGDEVLDRDAVQRAASELAGEGLRVLATAFRPYAHDRLHDDALRDGFTFLGLQGMQDPVRPEVLEAIQDAHTAGIRVIMLTGDHVDTASAVGRHLGLDHPGTGAMEGEHLDGLSDDELDEVISRVSIFARVAPEHKLRIVNRLKAQNHIVAVTGDGVNDAPALRAAHLGIAMGRSGTDVAREASDLVLADDNFATITAAVEEGRVVFANIRKVTFFLLSTAVGEVMAITAAILAGIPIPFTAAQILWVNLVTNGLQDVALAFEPPERGLLRRSPRPRGEGVVTGRVLERLFGVGVVLAAGTLGIFWWTWTNTGDIDLARTVAVTQMVVFQFFHVFNSRSLDASIFSIPLFSNRILFFSIVAALSAQLAVLHVPLLQPIFRTQPLSAQYWIIIVLVGITVILGGELDKWRNRRRATPLG
jgi:Ca2+-transporting ATPase